MRHERQTLIEGWNQYAVRALRVAIIGCGALGSQLAAALARLGVGELTLIDPDTLEEHNLENQLYDHSDIGKPKVIALAERLRKIDPSINIKTFIGRLENVTADLKGTILCSGVDNIATRHYANFLGVTTGNILVDAGINRFQGTVTTVRPGNGACLACHPILPVAPKKASCSQDPIPSTYVTAAVVANVQAIQIVKVAHGSGVKGHVFIDLQRGQFYTNNLEKNPECEICSGAP
ncbi:MAG: ThiF family adenylyltransferase [Euryarchaeota archaeon]|nr:ThiF family adenylyltransferase [Euryarchaeota archaeon]